MEGLALLIRLLENNHIKYIYSDYAGNKSIIIKNKNYCLEIFYDNLGFGSDLRKIPYTWGRMGITTLADIITDLKEYLNIEVSNNE